MWLACMLRFGYALSIAECFGTIWIHFVSRDTQKANHLFLCLPRQPLPLAVLHRSRISPLFSHDSWSDRPASCETLVVGLPASLSQAGAPARSHCSFSGERWKGVLEAWPTPL